MDVLIDAIFVYGTVALVGTVFAGFALLAVLELLALLGIGGRR